MDVTIGNFVWDLHKERLNIEKHKVNFVTAMSAFGDPKRLLMFDSRHSQKEQRYFCIGKVGERVLTVRFKYDGRDIRMIGAAYWRKWRKFYEKKNN